MTDRTGTLAIVGDVHRHWRPADAEYLQRLGADLNLFVGDLGDEDVEMVAAIARLQLPKVVLLGNHDAWQSFTEHRVTPRLRESLDLLGTDHLAYDVREVPEAGVSVVGARPFSWGGASIRSPELYEVLFGIHTMKQSAVKIVDAARRAQHRDLVILAHNGPMGLGQQSDDIWGKDFGKPGGDWGDRDLAVALERIRALGLRVRVVVAGHMHDRVFHPRGGLRRRFVEADGTLYCNPAVVPRIRPGRDGGEVSYFLRLSFRDGQCTAISEDWVDDHGELSGSRAPQVLQVQRIPLAGTQD